MPKLSVLLLFFIFTFCSKRENREINSVKVRIKKFPNSLNYIISSSIIQRQVFDGLMLFDQAGFPAPLLVKHLPQIVKKDSLLTLNFELRDSIYWQDGSVIKNEDIAFSIKVFKLPLYLNINTRSYLEPIKNVILNDSNLNIFSIVVSGSKQDAINLAGDFDILQKSKYDSLGLLDHVTFENIEKNPDSVVKDDKVKKFVDEFLKDNFKFKGKYLGGSGPYHVVGMEDGKFIKLRKRKNWWGEKLADKLPQLNAYPKELIYVCIPEPLVAIQALKSRSIDVMDDIPANEFVQLKDNIEFQKDYNLFSPLKYKFTYIGFNSRISKLEKLEIREALSYLINADDMIKVVERGYGQKTIGPINPANDFYYNNQINSREYNPTLAQKIFVQNGYYMEEGKLIDPKTNRQLEFNVFYRQNPGYESIASIFKQEAKKIGMKINLTQYEGRTISKMARNHEFEIIVGAFTGDPFSLNFSGLFSQEASKTGGMNFTGFGSHKSDSLIQAANYAQDSVSKKQALNKLQEELHNQSTMIFLYFSKNKIAINKKFENVKISTTKPGYDVTSFILKSPEVSK